VGEFSVRSSGREDSQPWARPLLLVVGLAIASLGCNAIAGIHAGELVTDGGAEAASDGSAKMDGTDSTMGDTGSSFDSGAANDSTVVGDGKASDSAEATDSTPPLDGPIQEGGPDSPMTTDSGTTCMGGSACVPAACEYGVTACDAGALACMTVGFLPPGATCADGGGVCDDAGSCSACAAGQDCSVAGTCAKKTISCTSGAAVCTPAGNEADGTPCGTNQYCHSGACTACVPNEPCTTPGNACGLGALNCTTDTCNPTGPQPPGTSCAANMVCNSAGVCVGCAAGTTCTPANPCDQGQTSCNTGVSVCSDMGPSSAANGMACSSVANGVCNNGTCSSCAAGTTCMLTAPANVCDKGQVTCGTGVAVCTDTFQANPAANGASCASGVCDNGSCVACTTGMPCTSPPANICDTGTIACGTGSPVCTDTGTASASANGTSCAAGKVCDNGACASCATGQLCTPTNPCHTGTISCTTGSPVCMDTTNSVPDGTSCGAPLACYHGVCECNFAGLVAYYTFDGNTNDLSGNSNNATVTGSGLSYTGGFFGQGVHITDTSTVIRSTGAYTFFTGRTFCGWVNAYFASENYGQPFVVGGVSGSGDLYSYQSAIGPTGDCFPAVPASNLFVDHWGTTCGPAPSVAVTKGSFDFICYSFDDVSTTTLYSNGSTAAYGSSPPFAWGLSTVTIGSNTLGGTSTQATNIGVLDEVSFWNRGLTLTEMNALYNGGAGCHIH
jgi:hypothetical protein